jgi:UDP-glucuronate 4-epimerase
MKFIVTGAAGFIGFHLSKALLEAGHNVVGIDNINNYYDTNLKNARLEILQQHKNFIFYKENIANKDAIFEIFKTNQDAEFVIHLAAQAGVRYSLENPFAYAESNLTGQLVILEACRHFAPNLKQLIYASSSSVYGANTKQPYSIEDRVDNPVSLYAATKKSGEMLAVSYNNLYKIPTTGLRFFTVYGEYGRPDMAYFSFTQDILAGRTIKIFNNGEMYRDFTYVSDIVAGILGLVEKFSSNLQLPVTNHSIYNLGNNKPVKLLDFVNILQEIIGQKAIIEMHPMQKGDVVATYADIDASTNDFGFKPKTDLKEGLKNFYDWYKNFYKLTNQL